MRGVQGVVAGLGHDGIRDVPYVVGRFPETRAPARWRERDRRGGDWAFDDEGKLLAASGRGTSLSGMASRSGLAFAPAPLFGRPLSPPRH